eukprot:15454604-Alexandrium_andersonii.AAC.1
MSCKGMGTCVRGRAQAQVPLYEVVQRSRRLREGSCEGLGAFVRCRKQSSGHLCTRSYRGLGAFVRGRSKFRALLHEVLERSGHVCTRSYTAASTFLDLCARSLKRLGVSEHGRKIV